MKSKDLNTGEKTLLTEDFRWARVVKEKMTEWKVDSHFHKPVIYAIEHLAPLTVIIVIGIFIGLFKSRN